MSGRIGKREGLNSNITIKEKNVRILFFFFMLSCTVLMLLFITLSLFNNIHILGCFPGEMSRYYNVVFFKKYRKLKKDRNNIRQIHGGI